MNPQAEVWFQTFVARLRVKMERGALEHGDRSLTRDPEGLLEEIQDELLDVCGWAVFAAGKVEEMRLELARLKAARAESTTRIRRTIDGFCSDLERVRIRGLEEVDTHPEETGP